MKSETESLNTQMVNEGSGNTRRTADTNEHDAKTKHTEHQTQDCQSKKGKTMRHIL